MIVDRSFSCFFFNICFNDDLLLYTVVLRFGNIIKTRDHYLRNYFSPLCGSFLVFFTCYGDCSKYLLFRSHYVASGYHFIPNWQDTSGRSLAGGRLGLLHLEPHGRRFLLVAVAGTLAHLHHRHWHGRYWRRRRGSGGELPAGVTTTEPLKY